MFYTRWSLARYVLTLAMTCPISLLASFGTDHLGASRPVGYLVLFAVPAAICGMMHWTEYDMRWGERLHDRNAR